MQCRDQGSWGSFMAVNLPSPLLPVTCVSFEPLFQLPPGRKIHRGLLTRPWHKKHASCSARRRRARSCQLMAPPCRLRPRHARARCLLAPGAAPRLPFPVRRCAFAATVCACSAGIMGFIHGAVNLPRTSR
jgi:hypothetical protein